MIVTCGFMDRSDIGKLQNHLLNVLRRAGMNANRLAEERLLLR